MSFTWKNGYEIHACRRSLIHCASSRGNVSNMKALLESYSDHYSTEEEIVEYLKEYPITNIELRREKKLELEMRKFFTNLIKTNQT